MFLTEEAEVRKELATAGLSMDSGTTVLIKRGQDGCGYGTAHLAVPYDVVIMLAKAETVIVGWTKCRIRLLERKQPKCFRCQRPEHCGGTQ